MITAKKLQHVLEQEVNDVKGRAVVVEFNDGEYLPITSYRVDEEGNRFVLITGGQIKPEGE